MGRSELLKYAYLLDIYRKMPPDSPELETLEDELDRLWFSMSSADRESVSRYGGQEPGT